MPRAKNYELRRLKDKQVTQGIRKIVKNTVNGLAEKKIWSTYGANQSITTAVTSNPTNQLLLPNISHGSNQEDRIGQEIRIKKAVISGYVNLLPYSAVSNTLSTPVMIKLYLVSSRQINNAGIGNTNVNSGFFEAGSGTVGFQGNMLDMLLPINKDAWIVHKTKTFNLGATYASSTGPVGTGGYYDNSKMMMPFKFDYAKYFKGKLMYSDDTSAQNSNYPINRNAYLLFQAVYADGSATGNLVTAEYHFRTTVEYTDF